MMYKNVTYHPKDNGGLRIWNRMIMEYGPVWTSSDFYAMDDQSQFYIELPPDGQGPVWWNAASGTKKDFQDHD